MSQLQTLCEAKGVKADCRYGKARGKGWKDAVHNWRVTLRYQGRQLTVDFFGGALVENPSEADVVSSLIIDANAGGQSFEDFCYEFGYDTDSRKAEQIWKACADTAPKIRRLLGDDFGAFAAAEH